MLIGEKFTIDISGYSHEGLGVGRVDNEVVFVQGALQGEKVEVQALYKQKGIIVAKAMEVKQEAPERVAPVCAVYDSCGGCHLQHASYPAQLSIKQQIVNNAVMRIGGVKDSNVLKPIIAAEQRTNYRNKGIFRVVRQQGRAAIRFLHEDSHEAVAGACEYLFPQAVIQCLLKIENILTESNIKLSVENEKKLGLHALLLRYSKLTGEIMLVFVSDGDFSDNYSELVDNLIAGEPQIASVSICQCKFKDKIPLALYKEVKLIYGKERITDAIGHSRYLISPASFFQINNEQAEKIYDCVGDYAGLCGKETILDIYCGIGTIGIYCAEKAARIVGIEQVDIAVSDARLNAELNHVKNAEYFCGQAEKILPQLLANGHSADVAIVDPPRRGCAKSLLDALINFHIAKIVYVSCDPATLARDIKYLSQNGYSCRLVQPVDQFVMSYHVECVALLELI